MDGNFLILGVTTDDTIQVIKEIGGLVAGITALVIALTAYRKSSRADTKSQVSDAKVDVNTQRINNVAQFQDRMNSDLQRTAENSIPKEVAKVLLEATPQSKGDSSGQAKAIESNVSQGS